MGKLDTEIGKLKLQNPVMVASGTFGKDHSHFFNLSNLGAIITKTLTLKPRLGNQQPRTCETASGMLNSIGLKNAGVEIFCKEAPQAMYELDHMGLIFDRKDDGRLDQKFSGGASFPRNCFGGDLSGHKILHTLYEQLLRSNVTVHNEFNVAGFNIEAETNPDRGTLGLVGH